MPTEEIVEQAADNVIAVPLPVTAVVLSLAVYGGVDLTRKGTKKLSRYLANRKALKANNPESQTPQS